MSLHSGASAGCAGALPGVGLAASFTCSKILTEALEFWLHSLAVDGAPLQVAGYNQILNVRTSTVLVARARAQMCVCVCVDWYA